MHPRSVVPVVVILAVCGAALLGAAPQGDPVAPAAVPEKNIAPEASPSPVVVEMRARLDLELQQVQFLNEKYLAAPNEQEALMIVREIRRLKQQTQIDLVQIQLRHLRESGDSEAVAQLENALKDLKVTEHDGEARPRESLEQE